MNITKETHIELRPQIQGFTDYTKIVVSRPNASQKTRLSTYDQRDLTPASERRLLRVLRDAHWKQSIGLWDGFGGSAYLTYKPKAKPEVAQQAAPPEADKFQTAYEAFKGGSERAFQHLLDWLVGADPDDRDSAGWTLAELVNDGVLDQDHLHTISALIKNLKSEARSPGIRYLAEKLEWALEAVESCPECGHAPCRCRQVDVDDYVIDNDPLNRADEWNDERH